MADKIMSPEQLAFEKEKFEFEKRKYEAEQLENARRYDIEYEREEERYAKEQKAQRVQNCITIGTVAVQFALYIIVLKEVMVFEKTGSVTGLMSKGFINSFKLPKVG